MWFSFPYFKRWQVFCSWGEVIGHQWACLIKEEADQACWNENTKYIQLFSDQFGGQLDNCYWYWNPKKCSYKLSKATTKFYGFFCPAESMTHDWSAAERSSQQELALLHRRQPDMDKRRPTQASEKELERQWPTNIFVKLTMLLPTGLGHIWSSPDRESQSINQCLLLKQQPIGFSKRVRLLTEPLC